MKKLIHCIIFLGFTLSVSAQQAYRFELSGKWNDTALASQTTPFSNDRQVWSDLIGWTDSSNGKEYVIMGSIDSVYFFDVSNPAAIKKCDVHWGRNRVINRDFEVYSHYVYCVSDNGPGGALQIFDLQYLPDSVHLVKEDSAISSNTHSIFIDSLSKRLYLNSTKPFGNTPKTGMEIVSLDDPENPVLIGRLTDSVKVCDRVHEAYFRNDTAYCSCEFNGLQIFDLKDPMHSIHIGGVSPPYPFNGYNHTSWLNDDASMLVFTDELPYGLPIKLYDVSDKRSPDYKANFNSHPGATPHNVIWLGNKLWTSAYEDGMVLWDMTNPLSPVVQGYYDTYHQNPDGVYQGLTGCWGVYPFFASGYIAASDMRNGLFMLKYNQQVGLHENGKQTMSVKVYPNPTHEGVNVHIFSNQSEPATLTLYNLNGQTLLQKQIDLLDGENDVKLEEVSGVVEGMYFLSVISKSGLSKQLPIVKY
ncbi:MAG: choice-of-anchor B family protein [Bacteroidota bacterium]